MKKIIAILSVLLLLLSGCGAKEETSFSVDGGETELVRFWETVPEMSMEEAKIVLKEKLYRMEQENSLGTLSDEERMALYVVGCNYYEDYQKEYSIEGYENDFELTIGLESNFSGDVQAYFELNTWEKQIFAADSADRWDTRIDTQEVQIWGVQYDQIYDFGLDGGAKVEGRQDGGRILIDPGKSDLKPGVMTDLHKEILRYYLSLGSVAYLDGPSLSFSEAGN